MPWRLILTAIGCVLWALPLTLALSALVRFGLSGQDLGDALVLIGVPVVMIALTLLVSREVSRTPVPAILVTASSALSLFSAVLWLAFWGKGI